MQTILIADDRAMSRELIREMLECAGYNVMEAADGGEVLQILDITRPDLILLDLQMPVLDGFAVVEAIRSRPELESLPVIALTASAMHGDREKALGGGFSGYLTKPMRINELRRELAQILQK